MDKGENIIINKEISMIKIGTIGSNFIVKRFMTTINNIEGMKLEGAYSRNLNKAKSLCKEFAINKAYDDLDAMLKDEDIDVIYIASPNSLHFHQAKLALLAGKSVICEKPFTSTYQEAEELALLARKRGLILFEAIMNRYLPVMKKVKEELNNIGKITTCLINFSQYSSRYDKYLKGDVANVFRSEFSGGALADLGIYNIHLLHFLFGSPKEAAYFGNINDYSVDMSGAAILKYDSMVASFVAAKDTYSHNFVLIQGDKGHIYLNDIPQHVKKMEIRKEDKIEIIDIVGDDHYQYEYSYFRDKYESRDLKAFEGRLEDSLAVMKILENLRKVAGIKTAED